MDLAGGWKSIPDVDAAIDLIEKVVKKIHWF
jgi:hypothetical protein